MEISPASGNAFQATSRPVRRPAPAVRRRYPTVERREGIDRRTLEREYLARNRPVVIPAGDGAWLARWQPSALRARFGDREIEAEETRQVYVGTRAIVRLPPGELVDAVTGGDASLRWKGLEFISRVPGMSDDLAVRPPPLDALLPATTQSTRRALWLAPKGTMSSLHHDGNSDNYNLQISGKKLFLLVPPSKIEEVYTYGSAQSPINPFTPETSRFPRFLRAGPVEATLGPGEILVIPKYWWHCVYAVEPSVNLNTWFSWDDELSPWRVLEGAPLFHRSCTALAAEMKRRRLFGLARASRNLWYAVYSRIVTPLPPEPRGELVDP